MKQKIRITTKADHFERRKQELLQAGYQIENEQPVPINGMCSFTAVRITRDVQEFDSTQLDLANCDTQSGARGSVS